MTVAGSRDDAGVLLGAGARSSVLLSSAWTPARGASPRRQRRGTAGFGLKRPGGGATTLRSLARALDALFPLIVRLGRLAHLPWQVRGAITPALLERHEMLDHVAGSAVGDHQSAASTPQGLSDGCTRVSRWPRREASLAVVVSL
jgi:hypothetical protein